MIFSRDLEGFVRIYELRNLERGAQSYEVKSLVIPWNVLRRNTLVITRTSLSLPMARMYGRTILDPLKVWTQWASPPTSGSLYPRNGYSRTPIGSYNGAGVSINQLIGLHAVLLTVIVIDLPHPVNAFK